MNTNEILANLEAIKQLKYTYLRYLDLKKWKEMESLFTPDIISSYADGDHAYAGRKAVIGFLEKSLSHPRIITKHQVHHPEIALNEKGDKATGIWYLTDLVINRIGEHEGKAIPEFTLHGTAFYHDEYVKVENQWKISRIGYERVFEEIIDRTTG
ncbi:MAG: nuclear transport factor 2 family protein, partial [Pseudomonadales bacterium]|nr:nuclear transport factor 2 family protein [Pseudomonadales bacterium]